MMTALNINLSYYYYYYLQSAKNKTKPVAKPQHIKLLCPRGAHTCAWPILRCRDLDINPMTLKLEGDLDILKMYFTPKMKLLS